MMEPCRCCNNGKNPSSSITVPCRVYNRPRGKAKAWSRQTHKCRSEFTVPVNGGKRFGGPQWMKDKCGDGVFGFPTRKQGDPVRMTEGDNGQYKAKKSTLVRPKSQRSTASRAARRVDGSRVTLVTIGELVERECIPQYLTKMKRESRRRRDRNYRARRGQTCG